MRRPAAWIHTPLLIAGVLGPPSIAASADPPAASSPAGDPPGSPAPAALLVFQQLGAAGADGAFTRDRLPAIRTWAAARGLHLRLFDARRGAPPEVTATPALVLDAREARVFLDADAHAPEMLDAYLRLARWVPQTDAPRDLHDVLVQRHGRATTALSVSLGPLAGTLPAGHDPAGFAAEVRRALADGLRDWSAAATAVLAPQDRLYLIELNPWRGADGQFRLAVAVYAPFDSQQAIYTTGASPKAATWDERSRALNDAAQDLARALTDAEQGRRRMLAPLPADVPALPWDTLGPGPGPAGAASRAVATWPTAWRVAPAAAGPRPVRFRFMPPLHPYAGDIGVVRGELRSGPDGALAAARATFAADLRTISMHDPELDDALAGDAFLSTRRFPDATFILDRFDLDVPHLNAARPAFGRMRGRLELKGISVPLSVRAALAPQLTAESQPRLALRAAFELNISPFDLTGPVGPPPSGDTMMFDVDVLLEPAE